MSRLYELGNAALKLDGEAHWTTGSIRISEWKRRGWRTERWISCAQPIEWARPMKGGRRHGRRDGWLRRQRRSREWSNHEAEER